MSKVALVTGGSGGLGAALSCFLGSEGFDVAVQCFRNQQGAGDVSTKIRHAGHRSEVFQADLSSEPIASKLVEAVVKSFGRLDILINCAGLYQEKASPDLTEAEWLEGLHTTATATYFTIRAALPHLRKNPNSRIVNIGDSACERISARDMALSYHIGKVGVFMITKTFAQSEAKHGITVNLVSPGILENSVGPPDVATIPAGRYGKFDDVYRAVHFLLQPENSYVTGSHIQVGGGFNLK